MDTSVDRVRGAPTSEKARQAASANALDGRAAIAGLPQAQLPLGRHLQAQGQSDEAQAAFSKATALLPASWAMWRQAAPKDARGLASGAAFRARVDALGDHPYHPPANIVAPKE